MKRLFAALLCGCLALSFVGCTDSPTETTGPSSTTPSVQTATEPTTEPYVSPAIENPMHALVIPSVTESTKAEDGTVIFHRSYQTVKLILSDSESQEAIAADLRGRIQDALKSTAEIESCAQADYPLSDEYWSAYFIDVTYTPTRIDRSVISLFANNTSYAGGPHPSLITESVTYDPVNGTELALSDILIEDYPAAELCTLILDALKERASELHYDYENVLKERFSEDYSNVSNWYFSGAGLCFHFSPYDIAPYSSGTIIATVPYDKLQDVLREQFLPAASADATGSMYAEVFIAEDMERFSFTADVELDQDGTQILLYPDAAVSDVRIESGTWYSDGSQYVPLSTVFAADSVGLGNAIVITADLDKDAPILRLVYRSGDQEVAAFIDYDADSDSVLLAHG